MISRFWFVAASLAACAGAAHAQTWYRQATRPTGLSLGGVWFTSPTRGFVCGDDLTLLETRDAGRTWTTHSTAEYWDDPFYRVAFSPDGLHGLVIGNNMSAKRTSDGGATWLPSPGPDFGSWYALDWIDNAQCFSGANGACAFTPDGGASWQTRSWYPDCPITYGMDFRDAQVGLVAGHRLTDDATGIFKTVDGGVTWTLVLDEPCNDVVWTDANRAVATSGIDIYETRDGGDTWDWLATGIDTGLFELVQVAPGILAGVSGSGDVWLSQSNGLSWFRTLEGPGTLPAPWDIQFSDAQHGWVVGQSGYIFSTVDGGLNWRGVNSGVGVEVADIQMLDDDFGIAVGGAGYLMTTNDGGQFWSVRRLKETGIVFGREEGLAAVSILDRNNAIVGGPGGLVFRTWDGGEYWTSAGFPFGLPESFDIRAIELVTDSHVFAVGSFGGSESVWESFDGGFSWTPRSDLPPALWVDIHFADPMNGWLLTAGETCWRTTDGGATWALRNLPDLPWGSYTNAIDFADASTGWIVGWYGYCAKTVNGGQTWTLQNVGDADFTLLDVKAVSPTEAWAVGVERLGPAYVWHTTNGGQTWIRRPQHEAEADSLSTVTATSTGGVWIAGYGGAIFHNRDLSACQADLSGSSDPNDTSYGAPDGVADASDFFYYLDQFIGGNGAIADISGASDPNSPFYGVPDGSLDASDFFYYLDLFVAGCS